MKKKIVEQRVGQAVDSGKAKAEELKQAGENKVCFDGGHLWLINDSLKTLFHHRACTWIHLLYVGMNAGTRLGISMWCKCHANVNGTLSYPRTRQFFWYDRVTWACRNIFDRSTGPQLCPMRFTYWYYWIYHIYDRRDKWQIMEEVMHTNTCDACGHYAPPCRRQRVK